jgi:type I restriction enzyme, S subunit
MSDLPYGWTIAPLGELVDVLDNQRIPVSAAERATRPGSVPYYGATGQVGYIDRAIFNESLVLLGEDGVSFLDAAKPKAYAISGPSWVNNHAHVLRSDEKVLDQRYLLHYLNCFDYRDYATGTTRLKLTKSAMTQIPVRLPPLAEQRRIAAALEDQLSVIDSGRSTLRAAQRKAFLFVTAAREAAFHSGSHEPTVRLCEILREPLRNGCSGPVTMNGSGVRVITLTAVTRNQFSDKNAKLCDIGNRDVSGLWLEPGDILIQRANTPDLVGTAALLLWQAQLGDFSRSTHPNPS